MNRFTAPIIVCLAALPLLAGASSALVHKRSWQGLGSHIQAVADIDGDGRDEMFLSGLPDHSTITVIKADASPRGYRVLGRIRPPTAAGAALEHIIIDSSALGERANIYVSWSNSPLALIDTVTWLPRRTYRPFTGGSVHQFALGDVDSDGAVELVVNTGSELKILDRETLSEIAAVAGNFHLPSGMLIGDVAGDGRNEIVFDDGRVIRLTPASSGASVWGHTDVWASPDGPLERFALVDIDRDGTSEVVAARAYGGIVSYRLSPKYQRREILPPEWISYAAFFDVDRDGVEDAVMSTGQRITAIDLDSKQILWSVPRHQITSTHLALGDIDGDGTDELAWTATRNITVEPLPLGDTPAGWSTIAYPESMTFDSTVFVGEDGQERVAILLTGPEETWNVRLIETWTANDLQDSTMSRVDWLPAPQWPEGVWQADIVAAASPTRPEESVVVIGSTWSSDGSGMALKLWVLNQELELARIVDVNSHLFPLQGVRDQVLDVDAEQIVILAASDPAASDATVLIVDAVTGAVLWNSAPLAPGSLTAADLDGDGAPEIVVGGSSTTVLAPRSGAHLMRVYEDTMAAGVLRGPPSARGNLVIGKADGRVEIHDICSISSPQVVTLAQAIYSFVAFRLPITGEPLLASNEGASLSVRSLVDGTLLAQASPSIYAGGALQMDDFDRDGQPDLLLEGQAVAVFELVSENLSGLAHLSATTRYPDGAKAGPRTRWQRWCQPARPWRR